MSSGVPVHRSHMVYKMQTRGEIVGFLVGFDSAQRRLWVVGLVGESGFGFRFGGVRGLRGSAIWL